MDPFDHGVFKEEHKPSWSRSALFIILGILTSCTVQRDLVDIPGKYHRETLLGTVGGTGANQYGPDGSQVSTYDTTQSFGNAMTAATTAGLASIAGSVSKATTASNNAVTTTTAKTAANASVAKASIAAKQQPPEPLSPRARPSTLSLSTLHKTKAYALQKRKRSKERRQNRKT